MRLAEDKALFGVSFAASSAIEDDGETSFHNLAAFSIADFEMGICFPRPVEKAIFGVEDDGANATFGITVDVTLSSSL